MTADSLFPSKAEPVIETLVVMAKSTPLVVTTGLFLFPALSVEEGLTRTAAALVSVGIIYRMGVRPMWRRFKRWYDAHIEAFFVEHHELVLTQERIEHRLDAHLEISEIDHADLQELKRRFNETHVSTEGQALE